MRPQYRPGGAVKNKNKGRGRRIVGKVMTEFDYERIVFDMVTS